MMHCMYNEVTIILVLKRRRTIRDPKKLKKAKSIVPSVFCVRMPTKNPFIDDIVTNQPVAHFAMF